MKLTKIKLKNLIQEEIAASSNPKEELNHILDSLFRNRSAVKATGNWEVAQHIDAAIDSLERAISSLASPR